MMRFGSTVSVKSKRWQLSNPFRSAQLLGPSPFMSNGWIGRDRRGLVQHLRSAYWAQAEEAISFGLYPNTAKSTVSSFACKFALRGWQAQGDVPKTLVHLNLSEKIQASSCSRNMNLVANRPCRAPFVTTSKAPQEPALPDRWPGDSTLGVP